MAGRFEEHIKVKRTRAAFHEASHIEIAKVVAPNVIVNATVNEIGGGDTTLRFPAGTLRGHKLLVAVSGFLGEAKGPSKKMLSNNRTHARTIASDINRRLRAGEDSFQVDVLMTDGETEMSTTNNRDFAFLIQDLNSKSHNFKAFLGLDSWVNEIHDAILECILRLNAENLWMAVERTSEHLLEHGWYTTEE